MNDIDVEAVVKQYQVKIPEKVANNYLSIKIDSDGMITIYWADSQSSGESVKNES